VGFANYTERSGDAKLNGYDALERKFDEAKLDYLNPARSSIL
jgi:hypothetical protein